MRDVIVIGAGIGGLAAAITLAARGLDVVVVEKATAPGGKARQVLVDGASVAAGPTVLTLREIFDALFDAAGCGMDDLVSVAPCPILARHAWPDGSRLDLFADRAASRDAIGAFAGVDAMRGFDAFSAEARHIWATLRDSFVERGKTNPIGLTFRLGLSGIARLQACRPYETMWKVLGGHFGDPRLRQLFGRYATYAGSSPFRAPATLMLIAEVEAQGVWRVEGGIAALARALALAAERLGVRFRYDADVAEILVERGRAAGVRLADGRLLPARAVIANCDPAALGDGRLGQQARRAASSMPVRSRSLSALTWMLHAEPEGFPLDHHNVIFSKDYPAEFREMDGGRLASDPSIYICAQDRGSTGTRSGRERFQIIVNAPALGDGAGGGLREGDIAECETRMFACLRRSGLWFRSSSVASVLATPATYEGLFPSTGGALYGRASHGWAASFLRPGSRSRMPGLYLAGGGTHPGAGVPMAAISGRLAASALLADRGSMGQSRPVAMPGGMPTPSRPTVATASPSSRS